MVTEYYTDMSIVVSSLQFSILDDVVFWGLYMWSVLSCGVVVGVCSLDTTISVFHLYLVRRLHINTFCSFILTHPSCIILKTVFCSQCLNFTIYLVPGTDSQHFVFHQRPVLIPDL